jgi:hypothetical protein
MPADGSKFTTERPSGRTSIAIQWYSSCFLSSKQLLSKDFPRARIMTFGYDADVVRFWTLASSNRVDDHGKSLVYALLDQLEQFGQRPIVFVAHSLGGLVCEEALNLSDSL